ncbi:MAG: hypothetical protein E7253_08665 [Lachnospiraceae bacterium]|nr:hypothetical protein [Lachnospiraceae bacterium]
MNNYIPKENTLIMGKMEKRWKWGPAMVLVLPYIIWAGFRPNFIDSLLSSKLQKNISEKWRISKNATFSDFIEGSFL